MHRRRHRQRCKSEGPVFVGRPSLWANPFAGRPGIGQARGTILYQAWLRGDCTPRVLRAARFSEAEMFALERWRDRLLTQLPKLRGRQLRCDCPDGPTWCHAGVLSRIASEAVR